MFAYGQTGSGKTFTMLGDGLEDDLLRADSFEPSPAWGVIPRAVDSIFRMLSEVEVESDGTTTYQVTASYMQIYNERLYDLLQDRRRKRPLKIRETTGRARKKEVYVQNLSEYRVSSAEDVLFLLQTGGRNRAVRGTEYNEQSSRSHALLQINVQVEQAQEGAATVLRRAKLNLVDLAGSEKWNTGMDYKKARVKELTAINSSLSALGNCIAKLTEKRRAHVPYRDSKLTRLLQDSLGGNTRTTVVACLSPMGVSAKESVSTMQFADRARRVMSRVKVNEVVDDAAMLARAQKEIARLKALLTADAKASRVAELERENAMLRDQVDRLSAQVNALRGSLKKKAHLLPPATAKTKITIDIEGTGGPERTGSLPSLTSASRRTTADEQRNPLEAAMREVESRSGKRPEHIEAAAWSNGGELARGSDGEESDGDAQGHVDRALAALQQAAVTDGVGSRRAIEATEAAEAVVAEELRGLVSSADRIAAEREALEAQLAAIVSAAGNGAAEYNEGALAAPGNDDGDYRDAADEERALEEQLAEAEAAVEAAEAEYAAETGFQGGSERRVSKVLAEDGEDRPASSPSRKAGGFGPRTPRSVKSSGPSSPRSERFEAGLGASSPTRRDNFVSSPVATHRSGKGMPASPLSGSPLRSARPAVSVADDEGGKKRAPLASAPAGAAHASADGDDGAHDVPDGASSAPTPGPAPSAAAKPPAAEQQRFWFNGKDVGARVSIYFSRYDTWREGVLSAYDAFRKMHMVSYDSGERKWHLMREKRFRVLAWPERRAKAGAAGAAAPVSAPRGGSRSKRKRRGGARGGSRLAQDVRRAGGLYGGAPGLRAPSPLR